ncbi:MAG: Fe-S cluster assembly protein SufB [Thaumarchaeota archaeon]|nr:Fe-S cluster assembly protein SufB [Nitrososphaerota archaeon]MDD9808418.1 Fe-S cluster assembly protein SufB [Nitrososphaerota archaeon]MDD9813172.1 Fe-S cluster assembly protein SufB [Nitrososphaerota archaeon]MDD9825821.1 Fe-S cluster assembly protein SufB [Nitrososphaerota archaeon]MDD9843494.1 Fe-S cluster assembly protein SufB [Nitrososphaerota archaeon]
MDYSKYDFKDSTDLYVHLSKKGLSKDVVTSISKMKDEPQWMLDFRLRSYEAFMKRPMPTWGADLSTIDFQNIYYYAKASDKAEKSWDDVPDDIKNTFNKLGIPEAEKKFLAGVGAQYESEVVYHSLREDIAKQGVMFLDTDSALKEQPEILKKYFGKIIPPEDNKFAALNSAVWSGGSFIYVPPGVKVEMPLQAYFRINAENIGQFERTLIIADEGAEVHYIEGCTAPVYSSESLHSAVVELVALKGAKLRYTTIQNWSSDVYNLVTKRAYAYDGATVEWIDGNIGSKITMKYPGIYLMGRRAYGETLSIAFAGKGQHQDTGAKMVHLAPETTSKITSKSVSRLDGRSTYRGLLKVAKGATGVKSTVRCDALLLDDTSKTDTYPYMEIDQEDATITHEATVGKIGDEQIFYLMTRGFTEEEALSLIVNGFMEPFTKELPMEYAVELNRLIKLEMDGSVG